MKKLRQVSELKKLSLGEEVNRGWSVERPIKRVISVGGKDIEGAESVGFIEGMSFDHESYYGEERVLSLRIKQDEDDGSDTSVIIISFTNLNFNHEAGPAESPVISIRAGRHVALIEEAVLPGLNLSLNPSSDYTLDLAGRIECVTMKGWNFEKSREEEDSMRFENGLRLIIELLKKFNEKSASVESEADDVIDSVRSATV